MARHLKAKLHIVHVRARYDEPNYSEGSAIRHTPKKQAKADAEEQENKLLANAAAIALRNGVKAETQYVTSSSPFEAIIKTAKKVKADLIVMASHGRRGLKAVLLGSETQKLLTHTRTPVLVVR